MGATDKPTGITITEDMTVEERNQIAARTFADYILGKRSDYLPTTYTGTEEQAPAPLTGEQIARAKREAEQFYDELSQRINNADDSHGTNQ